MLVRFLSSETGELLMFGDAAGQLLRLLGKETGARGSFLQDEMLAAAATLRAAVDSQEPAAAAPDAALEETDDGQTPREKPVTLRQRAWPLIDMLERTSRGGSEANIVWEAAGDF